jgi:hypothetical protein
MRMRLFLYSLRGCARFAIVVFVMAGASSLLPSSVPVCAAPQSTAAHGKKANPKSAGAAQRVSLSPRLSPGEVFHYTMQFETDTSTRRSGMVTDPQGPSSVALIWNAALRLEVFSGDAPGEMRLRITYEKSSAHVQSETFDPTAEETQQQYEKLAGKTMEFALDAQGKVKSAIGIEGITDGEQTAQAVREWIRNLDASSGAPAGGVSVGQTWSSDQPADSLPLAGFVWRTDSQYLRNEQCHPPNPDLPPPVAGADAARKTDDTCAVILTRLNLLRPRPGRNETPEEYRKNGVTSQGKWSGSGESLVYVSLRSGMVVSISQNGSQDMDVTLTSSRNTSMHYSGTILSRSQVELVR